jgi:hypothetical protein
VTGLEWGHLIGGDAPQQNSSGTRSPNKRDFSPTMDSMYVYIYGKSTFCPECTPSIRRPSVSRRVLMVVYQMYTYLSTEVSCLSKVLVLCYQTICIPFHIVESTNVLYNLHVPLPILGPAQQAVAGVLVPDHTFRISHSHAKHPGPLPLALEHTTVTKLFYAVL